MTGSKGNPIIPATVGKKKKKIHSLLYLFSFFYEDIWEHYCSKYQRLCDLVKMLAQRMRDIDLEHPRNEWEIRVSPRAAQFPRNEKNRELRAQKQMKA